jgi:ferrous iron transport protein B
MKIMVGIDLHSNNALCGLMDESGRRLLHKKLPCDLATILQLLEPYRDRIATILIAPFMTCSARLPVYTVLIAACIPNLVIGGIFKLSALTLLAMYLLGIVVALTMAWLFKRTLLKGQAPLLVMELPAYKWPSLKVVVAVPYAPAFASLAEFQLWSLAMGLLFFIVLWVLIKPKTVFF